ncbi:putative zinc binding dehydrogenase [Glonium stellatum]|uniref:Putative zinc binding dehydrogenase n=1 Tax=Glonium stellatum TaxID=574774 RepID=A0A8E2FA69_9PEZI|nr:putative zinc binding dehydrogenase [Glonium stellatum]
MLPQTQTAVVQSRDGFSTSLPLVVSHSVTVPHLPSAQHVLVRVLAVALNPFDHKMVQHFPMPGNTVGCDFCGVIESVGSLPIIMPDLNADVNAANTPTHPPGTRVCGGVFPYTTDNARNGAFAQWLVIDSRLLLRVPDCWSDLQGAALGGVGWGTLGLAFFDPEALALQGRPSKPTEKKESVLVYGGATATGTMACQLLKLAGYAPIAVTSSMSAPLAIKYGAVGTAAYTSPTCSETIRSLVTGATLRYALDCITDAESAAICFGAMSRAGGRYACLEGFHEAWRTRRAIKVKEVMGYEILGITVNLGDSVYTRAASSDLFEMGKQWVREMQSLLDAGLLVTHPIREVPGQWQGIIEGLAELQNGTVRGEKLVVSLSDL